MNLSFNAYGQARKAAALAESYAPTDAEADARLARQAKEEEEGIKRVCEELGLKMHDVSYRILGCRCYSFSSHASQPQINPDGHCLFSAVADQLAILGILPSSQATYTTCRKAAADYIYSHPDDFLPFLPSEIGEDAAGATEPGLMTREQFEKYCTTMRDTAVWGGEPEILALCRVYNVPIHVVQGGTPPVVVHEPHSGGGASAPSEKKNVVYISYHRRQYGLGEVRYS